MPGVPIIQLVSAPCAAGGRGGRAQRMPEARRAHPSGAAGRGGPDGGHFERNGTGNDTTVRPDRGMLAWGSDESHCYPISS